MGEERHEKHLNEKTTKKKTDKLDFFRSSKKVQGAFYALVISGGLITFLTDNPIGPYSLLTENFALKATYTIVGLILVGLAFAVLNKGSTIHTEDRVKRIESKLDKILERRDNVFQNK